MTAHDGSGAASSPSFICPICHLAVPIEAAKVDEHGRAVHEECYLIALKLKHETSEKT
ncbi:MAG: hypothetical protein WA477_17135 [Candidatus Sulfotelmatobacter sp.]